MLLNVVRVYRQGRKLSEPELRNAEGGGGPSTLSAVVFGWRVWLSLSILNAPRQNERNSSGDFIIGDAFW